jgi:hypothetical protein
MTYVAGRLTDSSMWTRFQSASLLPQNASTQRLTSVSGAVKFMSNRPHVPETLQQKADVADQQLTGSRLTRADLNTRPADVDGRGEFSRVSCAGRTLFV